MNGWCYGPVALSTCVGVTLPPPPPPVAGVFVFVCLCALLPACACPKEEKHPRAPVPRGAWGGAERRVLRSVSAEQGVRRREALARPLPGSCPGSLHTRSAWGVSMSPAHPHNPPGGRCCTAPRHRGARAGLARPLCPRRGPAAPHGALRPRPRAGVTHRGGRGPGPPPGQPWHHPQVCAPSAGGAEGAGQPRPPSQDAGPRLLAAFREEPGRAKSEDVTFCLA